MGSLFSWTVDVRKRMYWLAGSGGSADRRLFVVVLFVFLVFVIIIFGQVAVFAYLAILLAFLIVIISIFRDDIEVHRMGLRNFQFRFALGATQDLALFDFVFVHVDFGGTLRAADHGSILR
jgi:ABC-type cobalamin transport system permease subunit